jgi:peptidoglycan/xylan/chitin deacetylase (PgdA/CDA1 family)
MPRSDLPYFLRAAGRSGFAWAALLVACSSQPSPAVRARPREVVAAVTYADPERIAGPPPAVSSSVAEPQPSGPPLVARDETRAIVLGYHDVRPRADHRTITPSVFEAHVESIVESGVSVVPLSQLVEFLMGVGRLPARAVVIMFDDGDAGVVAHAVPLLVRHKLPFSLALPTRAIEEASRPNQNPQHPVLTWRQVQQMLDTGLCELASHSHTHIGLGAADAKRVEDELVRSRSLLESRTSAHVTAFVYPLGSFSRASKQATAEAGYGAAFAAQGAPIDSHSPRWAVPRYMVSGSASPRQAHHFLSQAGLLDRGAAK